MSHTGLGIPSFLIQPGLSCLHHTEPPPPPIHPSCTLPRLANLSDCISLNWTYEIDTVVSIRLSSVLAGQIHVQAKVMRDKILSRGSAGLPRERSRYAGRDSQEPIKQAQREEEQPPQPLITLLGPTPVIKSSAAGSNSSSH